ncbi:sigma-70-like protein [Kribbella antiqua]|uniref:Sigma-70-like protein n=1 Tax=Kribbella antiqua TaxID=2512217 RepID=A0A4V2S2S0_9ACTN|nr:sigma factor-like helix-turn-helix DNA-binding protein [Kribbella antiqua]TCO41540.1 sigma-70-like protein [Kribbella antiqua]
MRLVAVRLAANRHRNTSRLTRLFHRLPREHVPDPADAYAGDLQQALAELPLPTRQTVVLHYVCDLSVAEVADTLGIARANPSLSRRPRSRWLLRPLPPVPTSRSR